MVREIVHDPMFLQRKSEDATQADLQTAQDLLDTLRANFDRCVGMAANMIGVAKRIIAINDNGKYLVMFNPEITQNSSLQNDKSKIFQRKFQADKTQFFRLYRTDYST